MNGVRGLALLRMAANEFEAHRSPFETEWLADHEVTLDEAMDLGDLIAEALRFYALQPAPVRFAFMIANADAKAKGPA